MINGAETLAFHVSLHDSPGNSQNCLYGDDIKMASLLEPRCYGPFSSVAF